MIKDQEIPGEKQRRFRDDTQGEEWVFRFLGSRAVTVLNHWFQLNREYPYPDDERTEQLANEAGRHSHFLSKRLVQLSIV